MNTGYIHVEPQLGDFLHGDGKLGTVALVPDGQWDTFLPPTDDQSSNNFEPYCCVSEATIHCVETLAKQEYQNTITRSIRFLAANSGTGAKQGNDPNTVCESLKDYGTVYETDYPFTAPDYNTFYKTLTRALESLAIGEFAEFSYGHSWVTDTSPEGLMDALTFSPLSAAGYAWELDPVTGYYITPPGEAAEHDFMMNGYVLNDYWKIRDSYPPYDKKLAWNFQFSGVKRHTLHRQIVNQTAWQSFILWFWNWVNSAQYGSEFGVARSPKWGDVEKAFVKDHPLCDYGQHKPTLLNPLNVHHVEMFSKMPSRELDVTNLQSACRFHHLYHCHFGNWKDSNPNTREDAKAFTEELNKHRNL